jgi:hypothetical protein
MEAIQIPYDHLQIRPADFSSFFGEMPGVEALQDELSEVMTRGESIVDARGMMLSFKDIVLEEDRFGMGGAVFECGRKIGRQLKDSGQLVAFVCTAGAGVTLQYKRYMEQNDPLKAYFVDALGSIAVEKAIDTLQERLSESAMRNGMCITNRYSPGYCGWQVREQEKLFALFPEKPCGISLSSSSLMSPSKSVSGIIGMGKNVRHTQYECRLCELEKCLYRKSSPVATG